MINQTGNIVDQKVSNTFVDALNKSGTTVQEIIEKFTNHTVLKEPKVTKKSARVGSGTPPEEEEEIIGLYGYDPTCFTDDMYWIKLTIVVKWIIALTLWLSNKVAIRLEDKNLHDDTRICNDVGEKIFTQARIVSEFEPSMFSRALVFWSNLIFLTL